MKKLLFTTIMIMASVLLMGQDWAAYYGQMPTDTATTKDSIQFLVIDAEDDSTFYLLWSQMEATWEGELTNSAGLAGALSDETGTGVAVFGTAPTFTTSIQLGSTIIDETELSTIDGTTGYFDSDTTFWLLADTITLASTGFIDSVNTTWVYPLLELEGVSDSVYVSSLVYRMLGTTVDITAAVYADDTLNSATPSITLLTGWNMTDESGDAVVNTTITTNTIPPDHIMWLEFSDVTTEPSVFVLTAVGYRINRSY